MASVMVILEQAALVDRAAERADMLAYLDKKRAAAMAIAANDAAAADTRAQARAWVRLLSVLTDDLKAGLHEDAATVQAQIGDPA